MREQAPAQPAFPSRLAYLFLGLPLAALLNALLVVRITPALWDPYLQVVSRDVAVALAVLRETDHHLLVGKGARLNDSNNAGETPLITAVHNRNFDLMRVLLTAGADPDRADNSGRSARDYALYEGQDSAAMTTIVKYAKPKKKDGAAKVFGPSFR